MDLLEANGQWATRAPDERFWTLDEMLAACRGHREKSVRTQAHFRDMKFLADKDEVLLRFDDSEPAALSHWGFAQAATRCGAPAEFLRTLTPEIASQCLNHGLRRRLNGFEAPVELIMHSRGVDRPPLLRGITSLRYRRIWNEEVAEQLQTLFAKGWRVPPARPAFRDQPGTRRATPDDLLNFRGLNISVRQGDPIAPAGLYASDHDMFAFLVCERAVLDDGAGEHVSRGVFFSNSEVGDRALRCTTFMYRHVCGNHIVWDASNVVRRAVAHVGDARGRFLAIFNDVGRYADVSASRDEARMRRARRKEIARTRDAVVERIFRMFGKQLTREQTASAFDAAEANADVDVPPSTVWGFAQGLTRISQETAFADARTALDAIAGKLITRLT